MPDETDLIKAGAEGVAKGTTDSILEPFKVLVGEFCKQVGEGFGYYGRLFRLKMGLRVMEKAKTMLADAGIEPQNVPPKLFLPIMENASLEDNESLQSKWAALLANAANPDYQNRIHPSFPEILRQLSAEDAKLLDSMYSNPVPFSFAGIVGPVKRLATHPFALPTSSSEHNLERLGLAERELYMQADDSYGISDPSIQKGSYQLTSFGREFVEACQAPKKTSQDTSVD